MRGSRRDGGFSFIEILIVMSIIAVLSGLVVVAIQMVARKKPVFDTETRIQKLVAGANAVKSKWNQYPPGTLLALGPVSGTGQTIKKVSNHTNEGIESLVQAMYWKGVEYDPQLNDAELINTDDDSLDKEVGVRGKTLNEVVDGYGNPIVYIPSTEYSSAMEKGLEYVKKDGDSATVKPWKSADGSSFVNPVSFQIFSFGPDGEPNTDDDIKGW